MPVIPATWEAEAGESLEPGRQRFQWAEIASLHSNLGNTSKTLSQKKKKERKKKKKKTREMKANKSQNKKRKKNKDQGRVWQLEPVIPALLEAKAGGSRPF